MPILQMRKPRFVEINMLKVTQPGRIWIKIKLIWLQSQNYLAAYRKEPPFLLATLETTAHARGSIVPLESLSLVPSPQVTHVSSC